MMREPCYVVEGEKWPDELRSDLPAMEGIRRLYQLLRTPHGGFAGDPTKAPYGVAGYMRLGPRRVFVIPKCLSVEKHKDAWGRGVPAFLRLCRNLRPSDLLLTGPGVFARSNVLLPWLASYYSTVLWRALHAFPYLRYERSTAALPYLRGRFSWARQAREWASGGQRVWCEFRKYQADNTLNRLLKWATTFLLVIADRAAARERLNSCLGLLEGVRDILPERRLLDLLRLPVSMAAYREPLEVARALYNAHYPSLSPGKVSASGLLLDMQAAFEAFIDGIVFRAVLKARKQGLPWRYGSQEQRRLAHPVGGTHPYYTRPDNTVAEVEQGLVATRGVVIDAKYKGLRAQPTRYHRPVSQDIYQLLASCIARRWLRGLILAPATQEAGEVRRWEVPRFSSSGEASRSIRFTSAKVDLGDLGRPGRAQAVIDQVFDLVLRELNS
jgi:hypothetical protein